MTQNFGAMNGFTASWSLCIEEHFYLFFPFLTLMFLNYHGRENWLRALKNGIFWLIVVQVALRTAIWFIVRPDLTRGNSFDEVYSQFFSWIEYPTLTHLDGILVGLALSAVQVFNPALWIRFQNRWRFLLLFGCLFFGVGLLINRDHRGLLATAVGYPILSLGFASWVIASTSQPFNKAIGPWVSSCLSFFAQLSFALYLMTEPVLNIVHQRVRMPAQEQSELILAPLTAVALIGCSGLLYFLVERPFLRLRDRYCP